MLIDANLLLYTIDRQSPHHPDAIDWLETILSGSERVAIPWQTIGAFLRISTNPRIYDHPLTTERAWSVMEEWLDQPGVWVPEAGIRTAAILGRLLTESAATGNLIPDAQLAALAIEYGLAVHSSDTDFARWPACRWVDPLAAK